MSCNARQMGYTDTFKAAPSSRYDADRVGRQLARSLASELTRVWVRTGDLEP